MSTYLAAAIVAFAGMGLMAVLLMLGRAAYAAWEDYVVRRNAFGAYNKERQAHSATLAKLNRVEALCSQFGYADGDLHAWLDQRFAAHRDELRRLRSDASLRPDGSPRPNVQRSERHSGPALRAHLAEQDSKDKPS